MYPTLSYPAKKVPKTLLENESIELLSYAKTVSLRDFTILHFALTTGLRNSELCNLTMECVLSYQIVPNILMLPGTIAKGGDGREIPLHPDTRKNLETFFSWKHDHKEPLSPNSYVFVSKFAHNQLSPRDIQRIVNQISDYSIGRSIHPHTLRHTFATKLLAVSNLEIVRKVLGHKNIQTTQIYLHPSTDEVSKAINQL
ncbi:MAG: tyrosine-type recombinase/integrase [Bacteroidetes bacterium]|nr:tyrosine-type recombinase/integrase [Bacteroidota bacterium]